MLSIGEQALVRFRSILLRSRTLYTSCVSSLGLPPDDPAVQELEVCILRPAEEAALQNQRYCALLSFDLV